VVVGANVVGELVEVGTVVDDEVEAGTPAGCSALSSPLQPAARRIVRVAATTVGFLMDSA